MNKALLEAYYAMEWWDIPPGCLCPPVPGRADYIHYAADLLASTGSLPRGPSVRILDVGVGANCIYPIIGHRAYGWDFVGSDVDASFLASARKIIDANPVLAGAVELRLQHSPENIFQGIIRPGERFDLTLCNPPFHGSEKEARETNLRRLGKMGLNGGLNFGGQNTELWCKGGEVVFIGNMIRESAQFSHQSRWFTTLVSQKANLPGFYRLLSRLQAREVRTIPMAQGQKISRILAWTYEKE